MSYVIVTDACCDMLPELAAKLDIRIMPLEFTLDGKPLLHYADCRNMQPGAFYGALRSGKNATTSAINPESYIDFLTPILESGTDVLVLAFSSGLSSTYQNCCIALEELRSTFPERKIEAVDTLAASAGQALLVYHAALLKEQGAGLEQVRDWARDNRLKMAHWFTVDDLMFLKRGGRISAATAVVGSMLAIKPVLHVDDEGHLINVSKTRGRRASLKALVDKMAETGTNFAENTVFISHGDCAADAEWVAQEIRSRFGVKDIFISVIGPVVGAHAGPGTVALFFTAEHR